MFVGMGRIMTGHKLLSLFGGRRNWDQTWLGGIPHKANICEASAPTSARAAQVSTYPCNAQCLHLCVPHVHVVHTHGWAPYS